MTPARHNIVHVAKQHGISIDVECFASGTLARFNDRLGQPQALMFDNRAGHEDVEHRILACHKGRVQRLVVKPEHRASPEALGMLAAPVRGENGPPSAPIIHELSLTKALELVLHPDGTVTWRRMGDE